MPGEESGAETHVVDHNSGKYYVDPKAIVPVIMKMIDIPSQGDRGADANSSTQEPRMIGDFEGSANALWAIYGKEAKSHDEAHIQTLKDDMDGVLIFVSPYFVRAEQAQLC